MVSLTGAPAYLRGLVLLALLASALVLTGCARIEIAIHLNDDGSGEISLLSAVDTRFLALAEDGATEIENSFIDLDEADLPPGATIEEYDEDGFRGARIRLPFAASDDVNDAINAALSDAGADLSGELSGLGPTNLFERFDLLRDDGGWRFAAVVSPFQETLSSGDGDIVGDDILDSGLVELLLEDFEFTIRLDLPGDIVEHNADAVDGSALIWNLDPFSQEPRELMALTSGGGGTNVLEVTTGVVVGLLIGAITATIWLKSRRRSATDA